VTYSIVAADPGTGEVGVAVQSKYFAVGNVVPWAKAGVGAVATQAAGIALYGRHILQALEEGLAPQEAIERTLRDDAGAATRQLGVVTAAGEIASWTGGDCKAWAGAASGEGFTAQGNILAGEDVVREMARAFEAASGTLAERLMASLEAGQAAGGDRRGQQSAAIVVERAGAAAALREGIDRVVDLRVDDHPEPIVELRRLLDIQLRWDALRLAEARRSADDVAGAIDALASGLRRFGEDAMLLYDLACAESLGGRSADAVAHLRRSLELEPSYRELAAGDSDFATLAGDPEFAALTARAS